MNRIKIFVVASILLSIIPLAHSREVTIQYAVDFFGVFDHVSKNWTPGSTLTTATVRFDVDATSLRGKYYWEGQLQTIDTYFGSPTITSPFEADLPRPIDGMEWNKVDSSFSLATNIDYSVSWPDGPNGTGPFLYYQMNSGWYATRAETTWRYLLGFNLASPGLRALDIRQLSGSEILEYIERSAANGTQFSVGFNSEVYNSTTYQYEYGLSHLGSARIKGYEVSSAVPEPSVAFLFLLGLPFLVLRRGA